MKTRKRELIFVLALLLGWALIIFGCPGPIDEDTEDPPPTNGGEAQKYAIRLHHQPENGRIAIKPDDYLAAKGADVELTLNPQDDYEPYLLSVYDNGNHGVDLSPDIISNVYKYTFKMPQSIVWIKVDFLPLLTVVKNYSDAISSSRKWDEIDALNTLIKKTQEPTHPNITAAINRLAGVRGAGGVPVGGSLTDLYETAGGSLGVIRAKMRYAEADLKTWVPLTNWPSDWIRRGADLQLFDVSTQAVTNNVSLDVDGKPVLVPADDTLINPFPAPLITELSDTLGSDITVLNYVKANNTTLPALNLGKGWDAGDIIKTNIKFPTLRDTDLNADEEIALDDIMEIPLIFKVGGSPLSALSVPYKIWLNPVAVYNVEYDPGARGSVTIAYTNGTNGPTGPYLEPAADGYLGLSEKQTLTPTNLQVIGYVGKLNPANGTRTLNVEISTNTPNELLSVRTSSGGYVTGTDGKLLDGIDTTTGPKQFCPESRQYTIRVMRVTPPTGI